MNIEKIIPVHEWPTSTNTPLYRAIFTCPTCQTDTPTLFDGQCADCRQAEKEKRAEEELWSRIFHRYRVRYDDTFLHHALEQGETA